jgi:hypothetical protein
MNVRATLSEAETAYLKPAEIRLCREAILNFRWVLPGEGAQSKEDRELVRSVNRCGLLHSPLLLSGPAGSPAVIFGHRRIAAASAAGLEKIPVLLLPRNSIARRGIVTLRAEESVTGRALSELEKIIALEKLISFYGGPAGEIISPLSRVYGRKLSIGHISSLRKILGESKETLNALHSGKVSTGDLLLLREHPLVESGSAVSLLREEDLSRGKQKEAVRLIMYLADQGKDRWESFRGGRREDSGPLLQALRHACRPQMERDLREIGKLIGRLNLPGEVSIIPPRNLEGGTIRIDIRARDERSLSGIIEKLKGGLDRGRFRRIFDIMSGKDQGS